jgi:hypothetical protein
MSVGTSPDWLFGDTFFSIFIPYERHPRHAIRGGFISALIAAVMPPLIDAFRH